MNEIKAVLKRLLEFPSVTPNDEGCQDYIAHLLETMGFRLKRFDNPPVANLYAAIGEGSPLLMFAGHSDVVPVGNEVDWHTPPFSLTEKNGSLYGRGVADMKGSLAVMLCMAERFLKECNNFKGQLAFLITSGEEGDEFDLGTPYVMAELQKAGIHPDYCIVGEPSSTQTTGDSIKIGRRGSLSAKIKIKGKQGHVAYPHLALNPIHAASAAINKLVNTVWDEGNAYFPPTSLQITHLHSGGHAGNIIPGLLELDLNFRFSTAQTAESLQADVEKIFTDCNLNFQSKWRLNGDPFLTQNGRLIEAVQSALLALTGKSPELSTAGGTSDGRFIAPYQVEVLELGPPNATIHQVNEHLKLEDLVLLEKMYFEVSKKLLVDEPRVP